MERLHPEIAAVITPYCRLGGTLSLRDMSYYSLQEKFWETDLQDGMVYGNYIMLQRSKHISK